MNLIRIIIATILSVLAFASASAKTASWAILPKYEKLNRYFNNIYAFQSGNKWGLVREGNIEIVSASYDFITPFINGYALAGVKDGNRYALKAIIAESGGVSLPSGTYYLPQNYQYVSEGKLAVSDRSGKYGYIDPTGNIIVKCQFDNALPFKEGWAPVKQGNFTKYISETYDRNPSKGTLVVDFHYGEMTLSSCFSNGSAAIAYNKDFVLIGINGRKIKKLSESDFKHTYISNNTSSHSDNGFQKSHRLTAFTEDGKFGLKEADEVVVLPQFDSFGEEYANGTIIASKYSKFGVLKINDGDLSIDIRSHANNGLELDVDRKGNISAIDLNVNIPYAASTTPLRLFIDKGNGHLTDVSAEISASNGRVIYTFNPVVAPNAESCNIGCRVEYGGIVQGKQSQTFSLNYPVILRVSKPGPQFIRANENDIAHFSSTIYNDSNKSVTVTATWSTGRTITVTIPAHGSKSIADSIGVTSDFSKEISVTLSTGERAQSVINFQKYF